MRGIGFGRKPGGDSIRGLRRACCSAFFPLTSSLKHGSILTEPYLGPPNGVERPMAWNHFGSFFCFQQYIFFFQQQVVAFMLTMLWLLCKMTSKSWSSTPLTSTSNFCTKLWLFSLLFDIIVFESSVDTKAQLLPGSIHCSLFRILQCFRPYQVDSEHSSFVMVFPLSDSPYKAAKKNDQDYLKNP